MTAPEVHSPRDLAAALEVLAAGAPPTVLAGGTDLMVDVHARRTRAHRVLDLWGIDELRFLRREPGGLRIGALTTCTDLLLDPLTADRPLLRACAESFAAVQIRNRATVGGNLGTASPAADLNPVLWVLDAVVRLRSPAASRDLPIEEFLLGYRRTALRSDELIESVFLPDRPAGERSAFRKVGTRAAQSIAKVVVALVVREEEGVVQTVRAAAGSVADRTVELPSLRRLLGRRPDAAGLLAASRAAAGADCAPIDDVRSTAVYRRHALQRVLLGMLAETLRVPLPEDE